MLEWACVPPGTGTVLGKLVTFPLFGLGFVGLVAVGSKRLACAGSPRAQQLIPHLCSALKFDLFTNNAQQVCVVFVKMSDVGSIVVCNVLLDGATLSNLDQKQVL
jgi:hypothetical protein